MPRTLSWPLRLNPNGSYATVEQGSDDADREQLAQLILTRPGERPLIPGYGLTDPAFAGFDASELAAKALTYGPRVEFAAIDVVADTDDSQAVTIEFT